MRVCECVCAGLVGARLQYVWAQYRIFMTRVTMVIAGGCCHGNRKLENYNGIGRRRAGRGVFTETWD